MAGWRAWSLRPGYRLPQAFRRSLVERQLRMDNAATDVREAAVAVNAFGMAVDSANLLRPGP
jgi:hypothetical protein